MQIQERVGDQVRAAIAASQTYLLSQQYPEGYWWADLESNVTMTAEAVLLHKIWGTDGSRPLAKAEAYLRAQQRAHGGWELFYGDGGDLSTAVEAYMALRLLGVSPEDLALVRAREFILARGGITKTRIFTKLHLALIGCYDWRGVPSIPPWIMLLPQSFPIYEMSSWARGSTVPLLIVFDQKPVFPTNPALALDELYSEGIAQARYELPRNGDWTDIFVLLDEAFKAAEALNFIPFREQGLRAAERWVLERQEASGDWGGIIPAMLNSLLALRCLNYSPDDPSVQRGLAAVDRFAVESEEHYWVQPCVSPVWDTAWVVRSLLESGLEPEEPALVKGVQWLLDQQILSYGDWAVKNPLAKPGGWAFEFENRFYPDLDDSAVVVMALNQAQGGDNARVQGAIARALEWMMSMQCQPGGWGAFDIDNDQGWLNLLPYADLKAMIDPNTADVTARVLEMVGELLARDPDPALKAQIQRYQGRLSRALAYLDREQEADGSWWGRWGVNYIYGTSGVLAALAAIAPDSRRAAIERGATWLLSCQNPDGGWGETCRSYNDPSLKGQGTSTASQTAWAVLGLLAAESATGYEARAALERGVAYLTTTQLPDGRWEEPEFTGTGFPGHFYLKYHFYQQYFPLLALARYRKQGLAG